nr:hypothetical protein [Micromonospora provocatoris]
MENTLMISAPWATSVSTYSTSSSGVSASRIRSVGMRCLTAGLRRCGGPETIRSRLHGVIRGPGSRPASIARRSAMSMPATEPAPTKAV